MASSIIDCKTRRSLETSLGVCARSWACPSPPVSAQCPAELKLRWQRGEQFCTRAGAFLCLLFGLLKTSKASKRAV